VGQTIERGVRRNPVLPRPDGVPRGCQSSVASGHTHRSASFVLNASDVHKVWEEWEKKGLGKIKDKVFTVS
jgi:hypothetical protein